jgi:acetyltransferase-like isoleucine patch superfamily enzyme
MGVITIDSRMKEVLLALEISAPGIFSLPEDTRLEPPCSLKWMTVDHSLRMGAFSYAVSGHYFGVQIGRYTSIGEDVQIGRGSHPVDWASTSPIFHHRHQDVVDFTIAAAENFRSTAPYIPPRETVIGHDVYIGHGAFISQGVTIGDGAVIGARSVVTRDVPSFAVVAGSPAVVKRMRFDEPLIRRAASLAWWRFAFWDLEQAPISDPPGFLDFVERRIEAGMAEYRPAVVDLAALSVA